MLVGKPRILASCRPASAHQQERWCKTKKEIMTWKKYSRSVESIRFPFAAGECKDCSFG